MPVLLVSLFSLLSTVPAAAQDASDAKPADAGPLKEKLSETSHSINVGGSPLTYRALAGD